MHFPALLNECDPPPEIKEIAASLLADKAITRELGRGPLPKPIGAFIDGEFELARAVFPTEKGLIPSDFRAQAESFFRSTVLRMDKDSKNGLQC